MTSPPRPLPFRPRPMAGDTVSSYVRRLARANHLRPGYLRLYLQDPGRPGHVRLDWLAAVAGRDPAVMERALGGSPHRPRPHSQAARKPHRAVLFAEIRRDAHQAALSVRALADLHGVHRRTVRQALESPVPSPRRPGPPRTSRLDPYKSVIDDMLRADAGRPLQDRHTSRAIHQILLTKHGATWISYSTLSNYVASRRPVLAPRTSPGQAHQHTAPQPGATASSPTASRSPASCQPT
jgi:hypothetical protein